MEGSARCGRSAWYVSHKFSSAERNYFPRDQEIITVIYALRKFRSYLLLHTRKFQLYSAYESLAQFAKQPDYLKKQDWWWQEILGGYDYIRSYRPAPDPTTIRHAGP